MRRAIFTTICCLGLTSEALAYDRYDLWHLRDGGWKSCVSCDLSGANLSRADLSEADLSEADLSRANLYRARLLRADLSTADLSGASLGRANLSSARLHWANLSSARLLRADLSVAGLPWANLSGADLSRADLSGAGLLWANLSGADLTEADLSGATLNSANLGGADLSGANLSEVRLTPNREMMPNPEAFYDVSGLQSIRFASGEHVLFVLREGLRKSGLHKQAKMLTYAMKRSDRRQLLQSNQLAQTLEAAFNYLLFEITAGYGLYPGRPLVIVLLFLVPLVPFYWWAIDNPTEESGIWKVYDEDRVLKNSGENQPVRLAPESLGGWVWAGFYFSLLAATRIGWREINAGQWLARLQRREYTLKATGWVRTVAGIQSLVSVYMLALSALSYFGTPFG